jgi:hypothetical protein
MKVIDFANARRKRRAWIHGGLCIAALLTVIGCGKKEEARNLPTEAPAHVGAPAPTRLEWNLDTLVGAYKKAGHTNPKWDEPAMRALSEFARVRAQSLASNEEWWIVLSNNCAAALDAGCNDPMIRYLQLRFGMDQTTNKESLARAFCDDAQAMDKSFYPRLRKYYSWLRAGKQITLAYGYGTNIPPELDRLGSWGQAEVYLLHALQDPALPPAEAYDACHELLNEWRGDTNYYARLYQKMEREISSNHRNASALLLLKGEAYVRMAWQARGSGYADTVTHDGWKQFEQHLDVAEKALTQAWQLDSNDVRIATMMLTVELGQGRGRDRMELWFHRAMELDPNNYDACDAKLRYLLARWYGSDSETLEFGRECVRNKHWGGHVPLILMDAHNFIQAMLPDESEKTNYWKRPEVWADLKSAFDRFFALNPQATGWYHDYAMFAYKAGQWDALNTLIPKLGPINYKFFGGKEEFEKMVALAKEHAGPAKARPQQSTDP